MDRLGLYIASNQDVNKALRPFIHSDGICFENIATLYFYKF